MEEKRIVDLNPKENQLVINQVGVDAQVTYDRCKAFKIGNQEDYDRAGEYFKEIKGDWNKWEAKRKSLTGPLNGVIADINANFKEPLAMFKKGQTHVQSLLLDYERKIQEEERIEQARLDKIAEKKRLADEERAKKWADKGNEEKAEAIIQRLMENPVEIVKPKITKAPGVAARNVWKFRVINKKIVPEEYHILDLQMIGSEVRNKKERTNIPGIQAYNDPVKY